jgi:hypothetical protein
VVVARVEELRGGEVEEEGREAAGVELGREGSSRERRGGGE